MTDLPPNLLLEDARERIRAVCDRLGAFLSGSEDVFLSTGSRLAELDGRARAIRDTVREAVALEARDGAEEPCGPLLRGLASVERHLENTRAKATTGVTLLAQVRARATELATDGDASRDIPRMLRALAVNARIETARASGAGLGGVATEVRGLADTVESAFQAVHHQALGVARIGAEGWSTVEALLDGEASGSAHTLREARSAEESLRGLASTQRAVVASALGAAGEITGGFGRIVVSLQGHDATRQILEHVLLELRAWQERAPSPGEDAGDPAGALAEFGEACLVMAAQVDGARERLVAALSSMAEGLRAIGAVATGVEEQMSRLSRSEGVSPVERVSLAAASATRALRQYLEHERRTTDALQRVRAAVEQMSIHLGDVRAVATSVKLLALNALVETGRAGHEGRVLAVLARGIAALAVELAERAGAAACHLQEIAAAGEALDSHALTDPEGGLVAGAALERAASTLGTYDERLRAAARSVRDASSLLREEIEVLAAQLEGAAGRACSLEALAGELRQEALAAGATEGRPKAPRPGGRAAFDRYTMESEREVHRRALSLPGSGQGPCGAGLPPPPSGDLGANVELF